MNIASGTASPTVHIIMGVYRPDERLLRLQIDSILAQDYSNFRIYAAVDGPDPVVEKVLGEYADTRLRILKHESIVGPYQNFGRGLEIALTAGSAETDVFAFSDQDDIWERDKLDRMIGVLLGNNVGMVVCDATVIDENGSLLAASLQRLEGRSPKMTLDGALLANNASGMSMLFSSRVAKTACPFPDTSEGMFLHDWWINLVAAQIGRVEFINATLVRYRRHGRNLMGPRLDGFNSPSVNAKKPNSFRRAYLRRACLAKCLLQRFGERNLILSDSVRTVASGRTKAAWWFLTWAIASQFSGRHDEARGAFMAGLGAVLRWNL